MNIITLNNGIKMPQVGLGVFRCEAEEAYNCVRMAIENGYTHIDTAMIYGNEKAVGEAIKDSNVKRESLFITTKLWNDDMRNDNERKAVEESLKRLGLDYVDLYLIHWPVREKFVKSWLEMEKIYADGLAKAVGVSNFNKHHLDEIREKSDLIPAVNQFECHPFLSQKELIEACVQRGIQPEAWSPLGASMNSILDNEKILSIAEKYNKTPAQIVLRWDIECGIVTVPKSSNMQRQKQNIDIFDFKLTEDEINMINSLNKDSRVGSDPESFNF